MSLDVEFSRLIDATPEQVFDAFTAPDGQEAFYGKDDTGWIVESHCDLRIGGVWTVEFGPSRLELYRHRHVFEVIERPRRLVLASTETRLDGSSFHRTLEFTFEAREGKTLMTMIQKGFPPSSSATSTNAASPLRATGETRPRMICRLLGAQRRSTARTLRAYPLPGLDRCSDRKISRIEPRT